MSYPAGEALILTLLQSVPGFGGNADGKPNTGRHDWGVLNFGPNLAGIVVQDTSQINNQSPVTFENVWRTCIQVWQAYINEVQPPEDLQANVELVKNTFLIHRTLGDTTNTIADSQPVSISMPQEMWKKGNDGPLWLEQDVIIEWKEVQQVTYA